ncbi:MAG: hypothetical protein Fues2KO_53770 [Fuerstiella sp.]
MNIPISSFSNFCRRVPEGDSLERMVCSECDWIHYENPRIILTGFCIHDGHVLLARRAIPPRYGFWTLPGGFMEVGETMEAGACREVFEETGADVKATSLLATYAVPRIGQVHMVYLADLAEAKFPGGPESLDVQLFPLQQDQLPWDDLAFPVNEWALRDYLELAGQPPTQPFTTRPEDLHQRMSRVPYHPDFPPPDELP